ncbi:copper ion binding protein [Anaerovirgula multivorans]|uniref:Copper ion binding protein n=1 Tax=Anaerovirgula multivorans TaxID=312168 RepID=A0A239ERG3_9FIRM|nr:heavy metal-associated domain-containing protein [Anaerovirgula multivorans]SNS46444.1 copper ion binding protein [Anaerovirgula multivorans]
MKKKIMIEGMSCGHCVAHVERALKELQEVVDVEVDLPGKNAVVELKEDAPDEKLKETIEEAGYDVIAVDNL